ncbi:hypothetical protein [Acrocarpospora sp. B8E8]|uniref:hypothetical protein n=1 Tax=Acrocarpospora sp. B8E8 TaxID=3153572 RepID=UPI00325D936D
MYQNRRESAARRASRVIAGDRLLRLAMAEPTLTCAWYALIPCDSPALLPSVEAALAHNQKAGSSRGLAPSLCVRAEVMYAHGRLAEALRDARQAWEVCQFTTVGLGGMFIGNVLMLALAAHGEVEEAAKVLREVKAKQVANVTASLYAPGEIAVQLAMGQTRRAFETVLATRNECRWQPMNNPLATDWRAPRPTWSTPSPCTRSARLWPNRATSRTREPAWRPRWTWPRSAGRCPSRTPSRRPSGGPGPPPGVRRRRCRHPQERFTPRSADQGLMGPGQGQSPGSWKSYGGVGSGPGRDGQGISYVSPGCPGMGSSTPQGGRAPTLVSTAPLTATAKQAPRATPSAASAARDRPRMTFLKSLRPP